MRISIAMLASATLLLAGCQMFNSDNGEPQTAKAPRPTQAKPAVPATPGLRLGTRNVAAAPSPEIVAYMDKEDAELRARLLASGVSVTRQQARIVITMESDTTFTAGSDKVQPGFYQVLASAAEILTRYDRTTIEVSGHVDSAGGERGQALSRSQAAAVAAILKQHGVTPSRLRSEGVGKAKPVASNATSAGRAKNRRVEIQILPPSA